MRDNLSDRLTSQLYRSFIGFDNLFHELNSLAAGTSNTYPPYNVEKVSDSKYRIVLAVAGFTKDELEVETHKNQLTVTGKKADSDTPEYLHKGIAFRNFVQQFRLGEHIEVEGVSLQDGLLGITLVQNTPEELKPKKLDIL